MLLDVCLELRAHEAQQATAGSPSERDFWRRLGVLTEAL